MVPTVAIVDLTLSLHLKFKHVNTSKIFSIYVWMSMSGTMLISNLYIKKTENSHIFTAHNQNMKTMYLLMLKICRLVLTVNKLNTFGTC